MTRLERFKKLFPDAAYLSDGYPNCLPCNINRDYGTELCRGRRCNECTKTYWDTEVDDNSVPIKATEKMPCFIEEKEIMPSSILYSPMNLWFNRIPEEDLRYTVDLEFIIDETDITYTPRTERCNLYYYGVEDYYITQTANGSFHIFRVVREE